MEGEFAVYECGKCRNRPIALWTQIEQLPDAFCVIPVHDFEMQREPSLHVAIV